MKAAPAAKKEAAPKPGRKRGPRKPEKYAQVLTGPLPIRTQLSPDSPVLGMVSKGSHHPIVLVGDSWVKVSYRDTVGWIERRHISIVDAPSSSVVVGEFLRVLMVLAGIAAIVLIGWLVVARQDRVRAGWIRTVTVEKNLLMVARTDKQVQRYLSNTTIPLQKCFSEIGFRVTQAKTGNDVMKLLIHYLPDVVLVDWEIDKNIHRWMEKVLGSKSSTANVFVIFYNVPDPAKVEKSKSIQNAQYLGLSFTDREVFTLVTPLIITGEQPTALRKSVESSALEGNVADGSLSEVFQFVEIGRKTGCLLVEAKRPFGIIYFKDGLIVYAATTKETGEKAVLEILNTDEGRFRFVLEKVPRTTNCTLKTLGVLMEWTRMVDEAARG
jgi:hypothetical protein